MLIETVWRSIESVLNWIGGLCCGLRSLEPMLDKLGMLTLALLKMLCGIDACILDEWCEVCEEVVRALVV